MTITTATHLPVGTRVRIAGFAPNRDGLTGVVTASEANGFAGWTFVAMDRRATAEEVDLGYPNESLVELPAPTVSLVKGDPFDGTPDGVTADPRPAGFLQERAEVAERLAHLEEMQVRNERTMADQAKLIGELTESIRIVRGHRDELMQELAGARVIIEARDSRVVQLESALERRNGQLADATEAAEEYRAELKRALEGIAALAHSTLGDD